MAQRYLCPDHISWIVEQRGLLLIDNKDNRSTKFSCLEAAAWDLLTRTEPGGKLLAMLTVIADIDTAAATLLLENCLDSWLLEGWLIVGEGP